MIRHDRIKRNKTRRRVPPKSNRSVGFKERTDQLNEADTDEWRLMLYP